MAQMLPMVQVIPEMNFALDPATGIIGSDENSTDSRQNFFGKSG